MSASVELDIVFSVITICCGLRTIVWAREVPGSLSPWPRRVGERSVVAARSASAGCRESHHTNGGCAAFHVQSTDLDFIRTPKGAHHLRPGLTPQVTLE